MDREKIVETLDKKIAHAKREDCDFVYLPVWQAKQIAEYLTPVDYRRVNTYWAVCKRCGAEFRLYAMAARKTDFCPFCGRVFNKQ